MVKKPFKGNYLTFEVRASYDSKTDTIHLTTKDKDIVTKNGFNLALSSGRDAESALRTLMTEKRLIPEEVEGPYLPTHVLYEESASENIWHRFPLGVYVNGEETVWDSDLSPNLLVAGGMGQGKSVLQRNIINHCIKNKDKWNLLCIDPSKAVLHSYGRFSPTITVVSSIIEGVEMLRTVHSEMMSRYKTMERLKMTNILELPRLKSLMLMIEEGSFFFTLIEGAATQRDIDDNNLKTEARLILADILRLGRAAGIHVTLSVYQLVDIGFNREMTDGFTTRVAMGCLDPLNSMLLLDSDKATRLPDIRGRGYIKHYRKGSDFQGYYAPDEYFDSPNN